MLGLDAIWAKLLGGLALLGGVVAIIFAGQRSARRSGAAEAELSHAKADAAAVSSRRATDDAVAKQGRSERKAAYEKWARK